MYFSGSLFPNAETSTTGAPAQKGTTGMTKFPKEDRTCAKQQCIDLLAADPNVKRETARTIDRGIMAAMGGGQSKPLKRDPIRAGMLVNSE